MEAWAAEDGDVPAELHGGGRGAAPRLHDQDGELAGGRGAAQPRHIHHGQPAAVGAPPRQQRPEHLRGK